jgi:D-hexose-6-phosphate mutarotase
MVNPPLLFMSPASQFAVGKAIRGGVPIIFPWFGAREGFPSHGFARVTEWELEERCFWRQSYESFGTFVGI